MKLFKRTLSLVLAVLMLASLATIMASAVSKAAPREGTITYIQRDADGNPVIDPATGQPQEIETTQKYGTRPVITEVVNKDPSVGEVKTRKYRFYLPDAWKNDRNDNYDGTDLNSCAAAIYWWGSTYNSDDYKNGVPDAEGKTEYDNVQGWPGYRILEQDPDDPNIFVCEVPEDAGMIIFNNTVDGGQTPVDNPGYGFNFQTVDIPTTYTDPEDDSYGFYTTTKDGQPISADNPMTFDDMIFVVDAKNTKLNEYSGAVTTGGDWFYYYGDGKYGTTPVMGDEYFANGDFKSSLQISDTNIYNYLNDDPTYPVYCSAEPANLTVTSEDDSIATVSAVEPVVGSAMYKSSVIVTGVAEGETNIKFVEKDENGKEIGSRTCAVTNMYIEPMIEASNKSVNIGKTVKINADIMYAEKVTYATSKKAVATVDSKGVVKGVSAGKATITITATAGSEKAVKKITVTVKKLANPMKVTVSSKTLKASVLKKKAQTVSAIKVTKAQGKVTYTKKSGKFAVNKTNGKITVKKGTKKGKYAVKVAVKAAGNAKYNPATKAVTVKITVK